MGLRYFSVTVATQVTDGDKVKSVKQIYLVNAESVTDAEAKIYTEFKSSTEEFDVVSATATKIVKVIG